MDLRRAVRRIAVLASLLVLAPPSCRRETAPHDALPDAAASPPRLIASGIVAGGRLRPAERGNLTRDEAQVAITARIGDRRLDGQLWVELRGTDAPPTAPPAGAGPGGEYVAVPPGAYRVAITYRVAESAVGRGDIGPVVLAPATRSHLGLQVSFPTGTISTRITNRGAAVDLQTQVSIRPAAPAGQGASAPRSLSARCGDATVLPVGSYDVDVVWRPDPRIERRLHQRLTVEPDADTRLAHDFGLALGRLRLDVREHGRDITRFTRLTVRRGETVVLDADSAALPHLLPAGMYDLELTYDEPPLVHATRRLPNHVLGEGTPDTLRVDLRLGTATLTFSVLRRETSIAEQCTVQLHRPKDPLTAKPVSAAAPVRVPPGTWNAVVTCDTETGPLVRRIPRLVVKPRDHLDRKIRFW